MGPSLFTLALPTSAASRRLLLPDAVEILVSAQEQVLASGGGGSFELLVELVGGQHFQLVGLLEHYGHPVPAREIHPSGCAEGRGIDARQVLEPFRIDKWLARLGVEAGEDAIVVRKEVELVAIEQRRRHVRGALVVGPGNGVAAGEVTGAAKADRQQRIALK